MYHENEIPMLNKTLSLCVCREESVMVRVDGEIKTIFCDAEVLQNALRKVDGSSSFEKIESLFTEQYGKEAVKSFFQTLLEEKIIVIREEKEKESIKGRLTVIGNGELAKQILEIAAQRIRTVKRMEVDKFCRGSLMEETEAFVIALEGETYVTAIEINRRIVELGKPAIWLNFDGKALVLGPSVLPWKSTCLECHITQQIKKIAEIAEAEVTLEDIEKLQYAYEIKDEFKEVKRAYIIDLLLEETERMISACEKLQYLGMEIYFYPQRMNEPIKKRYSPITSCNCCKGMNQNVIRYTTYLQQKGQERKEEVDREGVIVARAGGFRSVSIEETSSVLERVLKKLPVKIEIEEEENNPFKAVIPSYKAHLKTDGVYEIDNFFMDINSQGKGLSRQQAYFSAAFELFERLSARYYGEKQIIIASEEEAGCSIMDLDGIRHQYLEENVQKDEETDWVEGLSLITGERKLIPASMVYLTNTVFRGKYTDMTSSGLSAGATLEDAILQGLMEIIEHDAWVIGQANQIELPRVDIYTTKNEVLRKAIASIENMGYEIITRDYSNDMQIPVFRTWIRNRKDYEHYATNGFGASLSAEIALERSITEAVQAMIPEQDIDIEYYGTEKDYESVYAYDSLYSLAYFVKKDMQDSVMSKTMNDYPEDEYSSVKEVLHILLERIRKVLGEKCDVLFVDLTREKIGIPVVRVVVTGDIQRVGEPLKLISNRTYTFQQKMKYSNERPEYEDLYMGPYPH